jgi:hypothetical protein
VANKFFLFFLVNCAMWWPMSLPSIYLYLHALSMGNPLFYTLNVGTQNCHSRQPKIPSSTKWTKSLTSPWTACKFLYFGPVSDLVFSVLPSFLRASTTFLTLWGYVGDNISYVSEPARSAGWPFGLPAAAGEEKKLAGRCKELAREFSIWIKEI